MSRDSATQYLLIDSSPSLDIDILATLLENEVNSVDIADGKTAALAQLETESYTCVISSVFDPEQSEQHCLDWIHARTDDTPLIVLLTDEQPEALNWATHTNNTYALWHEAAQSDVIVDSIQKIATEAQLEDRLDDQAELRKTAHELTSAFQTQQTRAEIEAAVCTHLASSQLYDTVWYSTYNETAQTLVPQRAEGISRQHLAERPVDDLDLTAVSVHDEGVNQNGTTVTVPLRHDGSLVGVLTLTTWRTINGAERALLADIAADTTAALHTGTTSGESNLDDLPSLEVYSRTRSHELRNHFQAIRAHLEHGGEGGEPLEQIEILLDRIERLDREATLLTKESLDVDALSVLDLADAVDTVRDRQPSIADRISLVESASIRAHRLLLELLLENLFRNTDEHAGAEAQIRVGTVDDGLFIEDTGKGISASAYDSLFEWGFSADGSTGIGLAVVKRIVTLHGWDITVTESTEGGARFEITGMQHADPVSTQSGSSQQ